jgi:hypothetical protein
LGGLASCGSTPEEPEPGSAGVEVPALRPWPRTFQRSALLVADRVVIEGPKGLLDHVALSQDPDVVDYVVETLPEGFRQVVSKRSDVGFVEIKAALDALEITALESVMVLERPGDVPVRVIAVGGVWWRSTDPAGPLSGPAERRGERLELSSSAP